MFAPFFVFALSFSSAHVSAGLVPDSSFPSAHSPGQVGPVQTPHGTRIVHKTPVIPAHSVSVSIDQPTSWAESDLPGATSGPDAAHSNGPLRIQNPHHEKPQLAHYRTEPDHDPVFWDVHYVTPHRELLAPGYFFISPSLTNYPFGSKIYNWDGELVWDARLTTSLGRNAEFRMCDWKGQKNTHICIYDARFGKDNPDQLGDRVFDNTYRQVGLNYSNTGELKGRYPGTHEYNMLEGGYTFLYPMMNLTQADLSPYGSSETGWIKSCCFQEADVDSGHPFYTWCTHPHLNLWEATIFPDVPGRVNQTSGIAGTGMTRHSGWDYTHLNSVDKELAEGCYLVSIRHMDMIIKVAGPDNAFGIKPGEVVWRLGGRLSDFKLKGFKFSKQHHVRFHSSSPTGHVITIFDNAWEGWAPNPPSSRFSSGMVIEINNRTGEATLLKRFPHPERKLSGSRGSFDLLPGGNAIGSWGHFLPELTEWAEDGTILFHARYIYPQCQFPHGCNWNHDVAFSYRGHKEDWHAWPHWKPKIVAYSKTCNPSRTRPIAYASWNGATEIGSWNFFIAASKGGPWELVGNVVKQGFETSTLLPPTQGNTLPRYVKAEAISKTGSVLGSQWTRIFVPNQQVRHHCDRDSCKRGFDYTTAENAAEQCLPPPYSPMHSIFQPIPILFASLLGICAGGLLFVFGLPCYRKCKDARRGLYQSVDGAENDTKAAFDISSDSEDEAEALKTAYVSVHQPGDESTLVGSPIREEPPSV